MNHGSRAADNVRVIAVRSRLGGNAVRTEHRAGARNVGACGGQGTLERISIFGRSLEGNLLGETAAPEVSIYLPPSYATDRNRRYPVVYMLHGYTNSDLGYFGPEGRRAHVIAERVFSSGEANEMILVMPNCMNASAAACTRARRRPATGKGT